MSPCPESRVGVWKAGDTLLYTPFRKVLLWYQLYLKPRLKYGFFFMLAGLLLISSANAQQPYSLINYNENILPQTTIGNIQQDENGYLWMSTQFGIVRFDGEKVQVFNTDNLKGLSSNRIRLCAKGLDNRIYFVDENNVIIKVKSPNQFEIIATSDLIKKALLPLYATVCNNDFGFLEFDKKKGYNQLVEALQFDTTREFLKSFVTGKEKGYLFYVDLDQNIRLCYYEGTKYMTDIQNESFKAQHTFTLNHSVFYQKSATEAFLLLEAKQKEPLRVIGLPASFNRLFAEEIPVVFSNETGTFLYASGKLYQYKLQDKSIMATLVFENLPCKGVVNVMQEKTTGDIIISTKSAGFFRVKKKKFSVLNLEATQKDSSEVAINTNNNIVYALNFWDKERIFYNGYLTPVSGKGPSLHFDSLIKARFNYYFQYPKDSLHIWLNFDDSLQSFHKKTGSYTPLIKLFNPKKIIELENGTTLILTSTKIIALQNNKVEVLYENALIDFTTAEKLSENCLVAGTQNGIYYFYIAEKKLVPITYHMPLKVRFIFKDKQGSLWFTTYGQGWHYLSDQKIIPLPVDNNSYLNIGHSIIEDNSGHFWIPTNHGLFKVKYSSLLSFIGAQSSRLYYTYFDKTDGFNTNEFNGGCFPSYAYQKETGLLFLPSMDGIVKFCPDSIKNIAVKSDIFFDEIILNDTGHIYKVKDKLSFPKQTSAFRLLFSSPYYGHNENIKFSYKVNKLQEQWKDLEDLRLIELTNLAGGSYILHIKREDANGVPLQATLHFTIQKNFTESFLFIVLLFLLVAGLVYLFFRTRLHHLSKERLRLEKEVAARTADQMNLIAHKEKIIAVLIHDIKSPLYFLNSVATHLDKTIAQNPAAKNKELSNGIATSLNSLYLLTQDFSIWLNASQPGHIQAFEKVDTGEVIEETLEMYKEIIEKKHLNVRRLITLKYLYGDKSMIKSVIRNLVDNAIKNTMTGNITITCQDITGRHTCKITIADEGKGMSGERLEALNNFFRSGPEVLFFSTSGFGHKVIKDFLQRLGGDISYRQNSPSGIIVTVNLTLINAPRKV